MLFVNGCVDQGNSGATTTAGEAGEFRLVNEKIVDSPGKTGITQHVVAPPTASEADVRADLAQRYEATRRRTGFKYHNPPNSVFIHTYATEEQAHAEEGLWLATLRKNAIDEQPTVDFYPERLLAAQQNPQVMFGLSEEKRRAFYRECARAEARALKEAMTQVPDTDPVRQADVQVRLQRKYQEMLRQAYGVKESDVKKLWLEGYKKGWPRS